MKFLSPRNVLQAALMLVLCAFTLHAQSLLPNALKPDAALLKQHNAQMPHKLSFIENKGQWQGNSELGTPRFLAKLGGANVWVTDEGLVYDFYKREYAAKPAVPETADPLSRLPQMSSVSGHVVRMKFAGAKNGATVKSATHGVGKQSGYHNYFIGNDSSKWATNVLLYDEAVISEIYDGIAAKIYFEGNSVRYDMIVQPGADPSQIALSFDGADNVFTNSKGDLVLKTSLGEVVQGKLFAYQVKNGKRVQVACAFTSRPASNSLSLSRATVRKPSDGTGVHGANAELLPPSDRLPSSVRSHGLPQGGAAQEISFALGSYDPTLPLVIDPLLWSTFLGGTGADYVNRITADASGNTYTCGQTPNASFPALAGSYQTAYQGGTNDGFITKFNATGTARVYSTFIGGSLDDVFRSIKVDAAGNAYVCGDSYGGGYPTTIGSPAGGVDWVITKLNAAGNAIIFSRYFGGGASEAAYDIAIDGSGNAYVSGHTYSNDFSTSGGCYQNVRNGLSDGAVCKLDGTGNMIYSTYIGGTNDDYPVYCDVDASGSVYLAGYAMTGYPMMSPYQGTNNGALDIVVTKMNATGTGLVYSTYIGGAGQDLAFCIKLDASNNVLLCGESSGGFPTTVGPAYAGGVKDGILFKLNAAGSALIFSRYIGGSGEDDPLKLDFDGGTGDIYVTGYTDSPNFPTSVNCYQPTIAGGYDVFVTKLDNTATTILYSSYFGGANDDQGNGIIFSAANTVFLGGRASPSLPTTAGAFQTTYGGGTADGFVTKFSTVPEPPTVTSFTPTSAGIGHNVTIMGTNFTGATQVQFGGVNATSFTVFSPTQITAIVPAGAASGNVSVTTPNGTGNQAGFTYIAPPAAGTIPPLSWANRAGAANYDFARTIAKDASGNIYIAGSFNNTVDFDPGAGVANLTSNGAEDIAIVKYDANGTFLWAKSVGGPTADQPQQIFVDASGNIYLTGFFTGTADFDPNAGVSNLVSAGGWDIFILKLNSAGNLVFAKGIGGPGTLELGTAIRADGAGNIYLTGGYTDNCDFDPNAGTQTRLGFGSTLWCPFLAKYDVSGNYQWVVAVPCPSVTSSNSFNNIAIDAGGNIVVTGTFGGTTIDFNPNGAAVTLNSIGSTDAVLAKYTPAGVCLWAKNVGSTGGDEGKVVLTDAANNIYYGGNHSGTTDFDPSIATANLTSSGGLDWVFGKYDPNGNYLWARSIGSTGNDASTSMWLDATGLFIPGWTNSPTIDFDPTPAVANVSSPGGGNQSFLARYDLNGYYQWAFITGSAGGNGTFADITTDAMGNPIVCGSLTGPSDMDPNAPVVTLTSAGGEDFVFAKYGTPPTPTVTSFNATTGYPGLGIVINGTNFIGVTQVQFGGMVSPSFTVISPTQLVAAVPAGGASGNVSVVNGGGTGSLAGFTFTGTVPQVSTVVGNAAGAGLANGQNGAVRLNQPTSGLKIGGDIFFTDDFNHRVCKYTIATGVVTTLAGSGVAGYMDATGTAAQFNTPQGLTRDGAGNLYVSDSQNHRIRRINIATGVVTTFAGSGVAGFNDATGTLAQFNSPAGLEWDGTNIFVCDVNNHRIRQIVIATGVVTTLAGSGTAGNADGIGGAAQFNRPYGITSDGTTYLYVAGYYGNNIRRVSFTGNVVTIAGSVTGTPGFADGVGTAARFNNPTGIAWVNGGIGGLLYIADLGNHAVRLLDIGMANTVNLYSGPPYTATSGFLDGTLNAGRYNSPTGIVYDASAVFYVFDQLNNAIRRVSPAPPTVTGFAPPSAYPMQVVTITGTNLSGATQVQFGGMNAAWYAVDSPTQIRAVVPFGAANGAVSVTTPGGTATSGSSLTVTVAPQVSTVAGDGSAGLLEAAGQAAQFNQPRGVAVDASGNIFVAEQGNNRIRKITPAGVVTTLAGTGVPGFADGPGVSAQFNFPFGLSIDASANLYLGDRNNSRIRQITPLGVVSTYAGSGLGGFLDGPVGTARFDNPDFAFLTGAGDMYVTDQQGYRVRKITGGIVSNFAGNGTFGFNDGPGATAQFRDPHGVVADAAGNVYIADANNHRIRKITPLGVVSTLAGSGAAGFADGLGAAAQFNLPIGLAIDASGNIYVADQGNNRIRKVSPSGAVITLAGSGGAGFADGAAGTAQFSAPCAVAVDASGNVFVTDYTNNRIRRVQQLIYQYVSGDAGVASNWRLLPGLVTSAPDFLTAGTQFQVAPGATATATTSFTLGAGVNMTVMDNATLALANGVTMTNNGSFSVADGAMGGRLLLTGTGAVTGNAVGYAGANATLESSGGVAKTLSALELPNLMPGKVVISNTASATLPTVVNIAATGSVSVNSGGRLILPSGSTLQHFNATALSFTVNNGGTLEIQGTGQISVAASTLNYVAGSTLQYSGAAPKTTNPLEFPPTMAGNLTITNTSPVTLDAAKTLGASATLTLTAGRIITSGANMLTLTNTADAAVSATAGYVDGPLQRDMPASLAAPAVTYSFPVGVGATAYPFAIQNPTTGVPGPRLQMQAFATNAVGMAGTNISLLSTTEYWQLQQINGNYTSGIIFLQKAGLTATNTIGGNPIVPTGTYNGFTSTFGTGLTTLAPVTGTGCFLVGTGPVIYDWNGLGTDWQVAANWSPTRTTPAPTDILRFNAGTWSPMNVPTESIQQLIIGGNVTLASGAAQTLSVGTGGVQIPVGNTLNLGANVVLAQSAGGTMTVNGTLNTNTSYVDIGGNFILTATGTLATSRADGINGTSLTTGALQGSGAITYTAGANYTFASTLSASTGFAAFAPKPAITNIGTLTHIGTNTTTLDAGVTVNTATAVNSGVFNVGTNTLTQGVASTLTVANMARLLVQASGMVQNNNASGTSFTVQGGGFLEIQNNGQVSAASASDVNYIAGSTLEYSGTMTAKTTTAREIGMAGAQNLIVSNTQGVTLGANATVQQSLNISNMSQLILSNTGNPTLTLNGTLNQNGASNIASLSGMNAGSLTLGGAGALSLILHPLNNTLQNFTVNRSGTHTIASDIEVAGTLALTNGILALTPATTKILVSNTAVGAITGGSTNSYVQGKLQRSFGANIVAAGTNAFFPVGTSTAYRPATLVNVLTGASPIVEAETYDAGATTPDNVSVTGMFSPRNWRIQATSGVFNGSALSVFDAGLSGAYVLARSIMQSGLYQSVGGTYTPPNLASNLAGAVPANVNHYFAVGTVLPFITSITPTTVSPGDTITITGTQLGGVSSVGVGGLPAASFQVISPTLIRAVVGSGASGVISLISPAGVASSMQSVAFLNAPVITGFDPTFGTTGSTVRIDGQRLANPSNVSFGGTNALSILTSSPSSVTVTVGNGSSGIVSLQNAGGIGSSATQFDFIVKPSIVNFFPKWGRIGDTVNIFGGNFQRVSGVKFGASMFRTQFTLVTNGQIRILVPPDVSTGMIRAQNPVGTDSSWIDFTYTAPPRLESAQPRPIVPIGQAITLRGAEFHPVPRVMIGTTTAASVEWTDLTEMKATFTQATTGILTIFASGGTVSLSTPMQVVPPPVISSFAPRFPSPGDRVTVTGANFFPGFVNLSIGGVPVSNLTVNSSTQVTFVVPPTVAGPLTISTPAGVVVATGQTVNVVPQPQITGSSGITTATIGQSIILQGTGLTNIVALTLGTAEVTTFATLGTTGTLLQMTVPRIPGIDPASAEIITTEATIALLTRSGLATYTMFFRNRALAATTGTSSTGGTSTTGTQAETSTVMRITSLSPVNLPEGSNVTLQGVNIATNATVWTGSGQNQRRLSIESLSTTAIVVGIPDGFVPPLVLSTSAVLVVSTPTVQVIAPFPIEILAKNIPRLTTFTPTSGSTRAVVTIFGEHFAAPNEQIRGSVRGVTIGGIPVRAFSVLSPQTIRVTVGTVQSGFVRVQTASGLLTSQMVFSLDTSALANAEPPEPVISKDSLALNRFFAATQGMRWTTSTNWTNNAPIALRYGVKVRGGRVVELRLANDNIRGTIPEDVLQDLDALEILDMNSNALRGTIPTSLTSAKNVEVVRLAGNQLTGRLPQGLCALTKLRELDLSANSIQDSLSGLCFSSSLQILNLRGNRFLGTMPVAIQNLTSLEVLDLTGNSISGTIPDAIGLLRNLRVVNLRGNRFTGAFPRALGQRFNGGVGSNGGGKIAATTQEALGLEVLDVGENGFTGEIPEEIGNFPNVRTMLLDNNNFTGAIPKTVLSLNRLRTLDVRNNQLSSGPDLVVIPRLDTLLVQNNRFSVVTLERFWGIGVYRYLPQEFPRPRINARVGGVSISNAVSTASSLTVTVNEPLTLTIPRTENFSRTEWRKNGVAIASQNITDTSRHAAFTIPAFTLADTGVYDCVITNDRLADVVITSHSINLSGRLPLIAPSAVRLVEPRAGEEDVSRTPQFRWTSANAADSYRIELTSANDTNFAQVLSSANIPQIAQILVAGEVVANSTTVPSFFQQGFPLQHDRRYLWRVRAVNGVGTSAWAVGTFTTAPEDAVLTASTLDFGRVIRFDSVSGSVRIRNFGTTQLTIESVQAENSAFILERIPSGTVLLPNAELRLNAYTRAEIVGNNVSAITLRFRVGMSSTIQSRTLQNRLVSRVIPVRLTANSLDTVIVGRRVLTTVQAQNLSNELVTVRSVTLQNMIPDFVLRPVERDLELLPNQVTTLLLEITAQQEGELPEEVLRMITIRGNVSTAQRDRFDTLDISSRLFARRARREDVFVRVGFKAVPDSIAPGGAVTLELSLTPLGTTTFEQVRNAGTPSFAATLRWNPNVMVLAPTERGVRPVRVDSSTRSRQTGSDVQQFAVPQTFWDGRTSLLLQFKGLAVAGNTDVTPLLVENFQWGASTVFVDDYVAGRFTAKACEAGGKRLVTTAHPSRIALVAPNPVKDEVRIAYTLREDGFAELALVDASGKVAKILVAEDQTAGDHEVRSSVSMLPSGTYTIRLQTSTGAVSTKVNVVR